MTLGDIVATLFLVFFLIPLMLLPGLFLYMIVDDMIQDRKKRRG